MARTKPSPSDIARVKGLGCLRDKTTEDCFNVRVITVNGKISAKKSRAIADAAEKFGSGEIAMTTRQTVEIQRVPFENIEPLREYLALFGLQTGGTGKKVRPIVSCKGTTCVFGLIDTFALSEEIHKRFYEGYGKLKLPHKFKIAVGGCPNNCVKPDLNDVGIIGQLVPSFDYAKCRGCKSCAVAAGCPMGAVALVGERAELNKELCNNCGRCYGKCPFGAMGDYTVGYRVYIGGRWGKKYARGIQLSAVFTDKEEVLSTLEKAILFFKAYGVDGERFADTIARVGFETAQKIILSDELLTRRSEIIKEDMGDSV